VSRWPIAGNHRKAALSASPFGLPAVARAAARTARQVVRVVFRLVARLYFDISYGLLAQSDAGRRFLETTAAGDEPVHGYLTTEDLDMLLAELDPRRGELLLDLGSGVGGVALEVHRRTGAEVLGVDVSPRAVAVATLRARRAGVGAAVTFVGGDLARPPVIGADSAYAIDSLMFLPDIGRTIRDVGKTLKPGSRLFATLLVVGSAGPGRLDRALRGSGVRVERLDDVTAAFSVQSRARAAAAGVLVRERATTIRGRLAMLLVIGEEALMGALVARGLVGRWRFVIRYGSAPERDAAHSWPAAAAAQSALAR
jgi:SAM-dependent methyltransferase